MSSIHNVQVNGSVAPLTTTEIVVGTITIPPLAEAVGDGVALWGIVTGTTGTGVTAIVVRVRQGVGITGTILPNSSTQQVGASLNTSCAFAVQDNTLNYVAGNTYSVTVQQTSATGNGSNFNCNISSSPATPLAG